MRNAVEKFAGFPASRLTFTPLPSAFFSRLLPRIDDLAELKVTLHLFYLLHRKKGGARFARWEELLADGTLIAGLGGGATPVTQVLAQALEKAVARGTVLHVALESDQGVENVYFLNTGEGREAVARLRRGEMVVPPPTRPPVPVEGTRRSSLVALFEQQISLLTPAVAVELAQAEAEYGVEDVAAAIAEAVRYEKRHWAYVKRVLENRRQDKGGWGEHGEKA